MKFFHMSTEVWLSFPEDEHFTTNFRFCNQHGLFDEYPILVETGDSIRFHTLIFQVCKERTLNFCDSGSVR